MQVEDKKFNMRTDCFLPRYNTIECFHKPGNQLFGIKFRIAPVIFEKKINFSEYRGAVFPLSYLIDAEVSKQVKAAKSFKERIHILTNYYTGVLNKYEGSLKHAAGIVSNILDRANQENKFELSLEDEAEKNKISDRTLLRYFETCTGIPGKKALQVMRIRKAIAHIIHSPNSFNIHAYGYHDQSHFYKHLKKFLYQESAGLSGSYLQLLATLHHKP
jgi:AraC-like DNA-binding protein